jgi:hypothetical protein
MSHSKQTNFKLLLLRNRWSVRAEILHESLGYQALYKTKFLFDFFFFERELTLNIFVKSKSVIRGAPAHALLWVVAILKIKSIQL